MASEDSRVKVAVSVRTLSEKEPGDGEECVVWTQGKNVRVLNPETRKEKVFKFDYTVSSIHYSKHETDSWQHILHLAISLYLTARWAMLVPCFALAQNRCP